MIKNGYLIENWPKLLVILASALLLAYLVYAIIASVNGIYDSIFRGNTVGESIEDKTPGYVEEVIVPSEIGDLPAWRIEGDNKKWLIVFHGLGGSFEETLPILDITRSNGSTALSVTYRNHAGAPVTDGKSTFGLREKPDVVAAIEYAKANGAETVTLAGYSHGAALVLSAAYASSVKDDIDKLVLISPATDIGGITDSKVDDRAPPVLSWIIASVSRAWVQAREDFDWDKVDYISRIEELSVPVLVTHGDSDESIPIEFSRKFNSRSSLVKLEEFSGAGHIGEFESDPERFTKLVTDFLEN